MKLDPKQARLTLGLNQIEIAKAMGVHRSTWVKWERGDDGRQITAAPARLLENMLWLKTIDMLDMYLVHFLKGDRHENIRNKTI